MFVRSKKRINECKILIVPTEKKWLCQNVHLPSIWSFCLQLQLFIDLFSVNPIQDGLFWGCSRMGRGLFASPPPSLKSATQILQWWHSSTLAQFYLTKGRSKKYTNHVTHSLSFADISIFLRKSANFATSRNTRIDWILIRNF